ncbi:cyclin-a2-4 [Anaeramoeba flamelloides]|uniref:Cyclin-a2-4 n=1 Tax=Anaeramoeba flamelloides TaxID=1746091 RepID=A0AAV8A913_9EUKA|nr:cyclin-a2-4 [Anaeramoeba flamelloides]
MFSRSKKTSNHKDGENKENKDDFKQKQIPNLKNNNKLPRFKKALRNISNFPSRFRNNNQKNTRKKQKRSLGFFKKKKKIQLKNNPLHKKRQKRHEASSKNSMGRPNKTHSEKIPQQKENEKNFRNKKKTEKLNKGHKREVKKTGKNCKNKITKEELEELDKIEDFKKLEQNELEKKKKQQKIQKQEKLEKQHKQEKHRKQEKQQKQENQEKKEKQQKEQKRDHKEKKEGQDQKEKKDKEKGKILDIDLNHQDDLLFVTEYSKEIFENKRKNETKHLPSPTYLEDQRGIKPLHRKILVNWLGCVCQELNLHSETLHLSINYFDRFLSKQQCQSKYLQLVAISCLFIASKYEEIYPPELEDLSALTKYGCTPDQILKCETMILNCLRFQCTVVTSKQLLRWYIRAASASIRLMFTANYLLELQILDYNFLQFKPSMVAASCVAAARWILYCQCTNGEKHWWCETMEHYTGYKDSDLKKCISMLIQAYKDAPEADYTSTYEKYAIEQLRNVSEYQIKDTFN